jgi:hypothetical protein
MRADCGRFCEPLELFVSLSARGGDRRRSDYDGA